MSSTETIILYLGIMAVSCFLAFSAQRKSRYIENETDYSNCFYSFPFILSLLIPWFFLSFTIIGVDYDNYYNIVNRVDWSDLTVGEDVETTFNLLCVILKTLTKGNIHAALFLMKTITVVFIGISIYILRDRIRVGYAIMAYLFLMYLASFYLLSICLASSIVMLAVSIWRKRDSFFIPLLLLVIAGLLHNSVFILLPAFALCVVFYRRKYSVVIDVLVVVIFVLATVMASYIYNYASMHIAGFHYDYESIQSSGSGLMMLLRYAPLFYIWTVQNKKSEDAKLKKIVLVFELTSCMFFVLGYKYAVIGRMEFDLLFLYAILLPELFVQCDGMFKKNASVFQPQLIALGYYLMRGYFEFISRTSTLSTINNYEFFNPFF